MKHTLRALAGPMLVALALAGCADQTAPNKLAKHDPARPNYLPVDFNIPGFVTVCRVGPAASDVASLDYALSATPDNGTSYYTLPSGTSFALAASPVCDTVLVSTQPYPNSDLDYGTNVQITQAAATGVTIDSIVTTEEGHPDVKITGEDNATVWTNYWHSAEITFYSHYTPPTIPVPLFVIGDVEAHGLGDVVNFWGAQWWKNNSMSGLVDHGVARFKGYATTADNFCGGTWVSLPGNSSNPPDVIPDDVAIIVTTKVLKDGPNISGDIQQILLVHQDGGYGPNPGHAGNGPVTEILCTR